MKEQAPLNIQWFPGHMAKTRRLMRESMGLVDLVVEILDARIPYSSKNPEIRKLVGQKPRLILLNKADLADRETTRRWCDYYRKAGVSALAVDCKSGRGLNGFAPEIRQVLSEQIARFEARGMRGRPLRLMVVGIPNVGKSSLINRLAGGRRAKVEDRPGVTRGRQWVALSDGLELMDMPGVLWPKFDDPIVAENLAFTGAIKDAILDTEALADRLAGRIAHVAPALLANRYKLTEAQLSDRRPMALLTSIGQNRGMLLPGGVIDTERAAIMLLDEYRGGKIGALSLEQPGERRGE
jgi:ribosome biogenesis GTPase A